HIPLARGLGRVSHERPAEDLELFRHVPLPPLPAAALGGDRLLAASPAPDPTVEDHLAALAVEHVLEVRIPLLVGARDDQQLTSHRWFLRTDEHPPSSPSFGSSRSANVDREPCQSLSGAPPWVSAQLNQSPPADSARQVTEQERLLRTLGRSRQLPSLLL